MRLNRSRDIKMDYLPPCMNARIGAASTDDRHPPSHQSLDRLSEHASHRPLAGLGSKPVEPGAIVGKNQLETNVRRTKGASSRRFRATIARYSVGPGSCFTAISRSVTRNFRPMRPGSHLVALRRRCMAGFSGLARQLRTRSIRTRCGPLERRHPDVSPA